MRGFRNKPITIDLHVARSDNPDASIMVIAAIHRPLTQEQRQRIGNDRDRCGTGIGTTVKAATRDALLNLIAEHLS